VFIWHFFVRKFLQRRGRRDAAIFAFLGDQKGQWGIRRGLTPFPLLGVKKGRSPFIWRFFVRKCNNKTKKIKNLKKKVLIALRRTVKKYRNKLRATKTYFVVL